MSRVPRNSDSLSVLPGPEREWSRRCDRPEDWPGGDRDQAEDLIIWAALRVIANHAVEAGDHRMAGRALAAAALTGTQPYWFIEDCRHLIDVELPPWDGTRKHAAERGRMVHEASRAFFVEGIRRRPARLLRAEARGLLFALRWLHKAGLLHKASLAHAGLAPWRRQNGLEDQPDAHPNIIGPLPPAAASLN